MTRTGSANAHLERSRALGDLGALPVFQEHEEAVRETSCLQSGKSPREGALVYRQGWSVAEPL